MMHQSRSNSSVERARPQDTFVGYLRSYGCSSRRTLLGTKCMVMMAYQIGLVGHGFLKDGCTQSCDIFAIAEAENVNSAIELVIAEAKKLYPCLTQEESPDFPRPVLHGDECYDLKVVSSEQANVRTLDIGWYEAGAKF